MTLGVSPSEVYALILLVASYLQAGMVASGIGLVLFALDQRMADVLGYEPLDPDCFKRCWDAVFSFVFDPVGSKVGALDKGPKTTAILLQGTFGGVVLMLAIGTELVGLTLTTGVAYASYYFLGQSVELVSWYQTTVAMVVILTIAFMTYSNKRIRERSGYV